ncbi:ATP synthase F1 subunit epsilon [Microgenomates group bacterium RIFCSPLOWO2_01_FULL_46_13]|nr:MAG: ATP synthase F1 subunit epsilon [Microgenomates group bacterium RIFCSPHIGHO2_01_FULL_45_11]OGV94677.1 MAG: ATP synthase F1 subunit epsilon [Microgenomates group bacterium RIFCSPLOWO2_01_FULL_46_13]
MDQLILDIVTQEKHLLTETVDFVSAPTVLGEVTILPHHLSLFTKLDAGEIKYHKAGKLTSFVISGGFMDVSGGKKVVVLADSAIRSDLVTEAQAQEAIVRAKQTMKEKRSQQEFLQAEAQLRRSLMELRVARRRKERQVPMAQ